MATNTQPAAGAPDASEIFSSIQEGYAKARVTNAQGVLSQVAINAGISVLIFVLFCFFRPRQNKIYAPKVKYALPPREDDPDYEPPPPQLGRGFFAWVRPVLTYNESQMLQTCGLDAVAFLRMVRMLIYIFACASVLGVVLAILYGVYNLKHVDSVNRQDKLSAITIQNVTDAWAWPAVAVNYLLTFVVMFFVWHNWRVIAKLRHDWFRSPSYQHKLSSRTIMLTQVPKEYRSDEGLVHLMGRLKVEGIKITNEIDCATIGRRLGDFPQLVEDHNQAVKDLEKTLVKYLKNGKMASKRPVLRKGGWACFGGQKVDKIEYLANEIKYLRDKVDAKRQYIDSLLKRERKARKHPFKSGQIEERIEGETYGFVTFKTVAEAHRIARIYAGKVKDMGGAHLQLAPEPRDIIWQNLTKDGPELVTARNLGWIFIALICLANTVPVLLITVLGNLALWAKYWGPLQSWQYHSQWSFSIISGLLAPSVLALLAFILPYVLRRVCKYQGARTRSRLDRATFARYYFFMVMWYLVFFTILGVIVNLVINIVKDVQGKKSAADIFGMFKDLPRDVQSTYVQQSTYWLTWLPLRGFLIFFEIIQLLRLTLVSFKRVMYSYTPRDIRDLTRPPAFEYYIVGVNLLFLATVGLVYAPLAPLVAAGCLCVLLFSLLIYKYQLLYVYVTKAESGGRMWRVYVNRLLMATLFMQLLMIVTTGLIRAHWIDAIASAPPVLILLGFKIWLNRTIEFNFKYYIATPSEAEAQREAAMSEKRVHKSEVNRRFLNPALRRDRIYNVMVHKNQEELARAVLAEYPWFTSKHEADGVEVMAVREENLEYNPLRDDKDWDTRSVKSNMTGLTGFTALSKSEYGEDAVPMLRHNRSFGDSLSALPEENMSTDALVLGAAPAGMAPTAYQAPYPEPWAQDGSYPPRPFGQRPPPPVHQNSNSSFGSSPRMPPLDRFDSNGSVGRSVFPAPTYSGYAPVRNPSANDLAQYGYGADITNMYPGPPPGGRY